MGTDDSSRVSPTIVSWEEPQAFIPIYTENIPGAAPIQAQLIGDVL